MRFGTVCSKGKCKKKEGINAVDRGDTLCMSMSAFFDNHKKPCSWIAAFMNSPRKKPW